MDRVPALILFRIAEPAINWIYWSHNARNRQLIPNAYIVKDVFLPYFEILLVEWGNIIHFIVIYVTKIVPYINNLLLPAITKFSRSQFSIFRTATNFNHSNGN